MSFVNSNFSSIQDLKFVDKRIEELQALKSETQKAAHAKVQGNSVDDLEPDAAQDIANGIIQKIDAICVSKDGQEALEKLDSAIGEFGDLKCFADLKRLISDRDSISNTITCLKEMSAIEERLEMADLDVSGLEAIAKEINDIADEFSTKEAIQSLHSELNKRIQSMRTESTEELVKCLDGVNWFSANNQDKSLGSDAFKKIVSNLETLVLLQSIRDKPVYPNTWWALEILLEPVITRFNYHFNSNKDTNKISKPEWSFNFIESFLDENLSFLELVVGEIFTKVERLAAYEIITTFLHPIREKIRLMMNTLNDNVAKFKDNHEHLEKNGRLLSHLVFELSAFDQRLRNKYKYNPYIQSLHEVPRRKWIGLTGDILLSESNSDIGAINWLNFEYNLAMKRFNTEILNSSNAFNIDQDFRSSTENNELDELLLKPTYSAYNLIKLFNNLTSHYRTLAIIKYQLRYLSTIQLNMLDRYAEKMKELMKKFDESFDSKLSFGFLPGGMNKSHTDNSLTDSLKGLEQLTAIYCSIVFVKDNLVQWSEDLIFVQLWNAFVSIGNKKNIKDMSMFDESFKNYSNLADVAMAKYERFFKQQIKQAFKEYVNFGEWSSKGSVEDIEPSNSLSIVLTVVPTYMNFLKKCISHLDYLLIVDKATTSIFKIFYEYIITNNQFNRTGRIQLRTDFEYLVSQLKAPLCLPATDELSNENNKEFIKIFQSVDLFNSMDAGMAKEYQYNDSKLDQLRSTFPHSLSSLSNHNLNDLLQRFV